MTRVKLLGAAAVLWLASGCDVSVDNKSLENHAEALGASVENAAEAAGNGAERIGEAVENQAEALDSIDIDVNGGGNAAEANAQ
jgi:CMP-2-keto-3-deoxyoctulosonic acid synthetase